MNKYNSRGVRNVCREDKLREGGMSVPEEIKIL